jgi:hypothetical protein
VGAVIRWILGILISAGLGLLFIVILRHILRIRRVRRTFQSLPQEVKDDVLRLIQEAARDGPAVTFFRLEKESQCSDDEVLIQSHVGGLPYAERGEDWPSVEPATFLLQVRLDEPSLGTPWQGLLLTVFLGLDMELVVRSHANPSPNRYAALASTLTPLPCIRLTSLRMPAEDDDGRRPASPARLCEMAPAIKDVLSRYTHDHAGLLTQVLHPNLYGYDLETPSIAYSGGDPTLIQNPHDPTCEECGRPMRFLFQFGEIIPTLQLADAGVCYVYGCDRHPDHCKGFIDSH